MWKGADLRHLHDDLVRWVRPGDLLVGHNLHRHDRPELARRHPSSPLLSLPTLDTLELSVLAFPRRPYHRLVKDDRLVRDALPRPLSDVRASERVLRDALAALAALDEPESRLLSALLSRLEVSDHARAGWDHLRATLGWPDASPLDLAAAWSDRACRHSPELRPERVDLPLLMLAAWLRVARHGDGSVLPAWVRRTWPGTPARARSLRATRCDDPACSWCTAQLSPDRWLQQVFGFPAYRDVPAAPDGSSLQRLLVDRGLQGLPTFGILPTGGGKSLCFQVPAEARHRLLGQLTVVISPLQSLMKDQVDSLRERIPHARALYGGLPSLLRPQVMDEVRRGECGLLYLSPEQLRNASVLRLLSQRELGAVVFDEAHCLSQWGHDFRTDYPYVLRAVHEITAGQAAPMPPVFLFTATTQRDATVQIVQHVRDTAQQEVLVLDGGSERENLTYRVRQVPPHARLDVIVELLGTHLGDGTAIVFCGSRARTEATADELTDRGYPTEAYHAGLAADARREIQDAFLRGEHRIITATNAFGMGVDKPDVRLVVHLDMPSSLEAYLQEAGRAGRDRQPAEAVLLWAPGDAEARFSLGAGSDLSMEDLRALWRAIQQLPARVDKGVERRVVTPRELLYQEAVTGHFDPTERGDETRVKAAVNWLERAHLLERRSNETRVFSGRPRLPTLEAALAAVDTLGLQPARAEQWRVVLRALYDAEDDGLSADVIAEASRQMSFTDPLEGGLRVLSILQQLVDVRLVTPGQTFSAFLARGVRDPSTERRRRWGVREEELVERLVEDGLGTGEVHLRSVAEHLSRDGHACTPAEVARLLRTWPAVRLGLSAAPTVARFRHRRSVGLLDLDVPLSELTGLLSTRRDVAAVVLDALIASTDARGSRILVSGTLEDLVDRVSQNLTLRARVRGPVEAVRTAVAWLHELRVITVQSGLAIFRSAMQLDRQIDGPTRLGGEGDDSSEARQALREHQAQRILRVHVMDAWARAMLDDPSRAEALRVDWFALPIPEFRERWFPRQAQQVRRPTTAGSYRTIVTDLRDRAQQALVTADTRRSHLVLAGPGSGKTRVLVHRVAWLLRVQRVRARRILVVCYTRANAVELRRRLRALVGSDARGVQVRTLHSVALSMVGLHRLDDLDLDACIEEATRLLAPEHLATEDQVRQRDAVLDGVQYLLIDEYQDIDARRYALLSAIAGRAMGGDQRKLRVFAVGDDDQAIFAWDGASTDFIRSFEEDYRAVPHVLPHSYRCPAAVLDLAQRLVDPLPGRLKAGTWLTVDPARVDDPPTGPWAAHHLRGRVPWHRCASARAAATLAVATAADLIADGAEPSTVAILARTRPRGLHPLRLAAEAARVPFSWALPGSASVPVARVREVFAIRELLEGRTGSIRDTELAEVIDGLGATPWAAALREWLEPHVGQRRPAVAWAHDLFGWARLERSARTLGSGVHLGTLHSAKGLEFDHLLLLDDGTLADGPEARRLVYVALTRARRSLHLFSSERPSGAFAALRHPALDVRTSPPLAADAPAPRDYGLVSLDATWLDWLGQQGPAHPGHGAMARARPGDPFTVVRQGTGLAVVDGAGQVVSLLSRGGRQVWEPRVARGLRLKLVAAVRERAETREEPYRSRLRVEQWWTGIWEARWRT